MKPNRGALPATVLSTAAAACLVAGATPADATDRIPEGRQMTDRSIVHNLVVEGTPEEIYPLWMTREGVNRFFGVEAVIDGEVGGAYEIYFFPLNHPESTINSTKGAKLLWTQPGEVLAFEWTAPPFARELNEIDPLPTWIEVSLEPLADHPGRTRLHLAHHGFQRGGAWDRIYETFWRWWSDILFRLQTIQANHAE